MNLCKYFLFLVFISNASICFAEDNTALYSKTLYEGCKFSFFDIGGGNFRNKEENKFYTDLYKNRRSIYDGISFTCQTITNENGSQVINGEGDGDFMGINISKKGAKGVDESYWGKYPVRKVNSFTKIKNKNGYTFEVADLMCSWSESSRKTHRIITFCTVPKYQFCGIYSGASEEDKFAFKLTLGQLKKFLSNIDLVVDVPKE